jgi:ABC-type phosphate/phosphonate transport system permease subunit
MIMGDLTFIASRIKMELTYLKKGNKTCSEVIDDMETKPIVNLSSCGASHIQLFLYGIIPMVIISIPFMILT